MSNKPIRPVGWEEEAVSDRPAEEVRALFAVLSKSARRDLRCAIMTAIALGDRADLEAAFPELADANPNHGEWPFLNGEGM